MALKVEKQMTPNPKNKRIALKRNSGAYKRLRKECFERDNWTCQYCKEMFNENDHPLQPHHLKFRSQGGSDEINNLISLCFFCHMELHDGHIPRDFMDKQ